MISYKVSMDMVSFNLMRVLMYSISWTLKLLAYKVLSYSYEKGEISKVNIYLVWASQKVHMIMINSVAMDLIPYSIRAMFQSNGLPFWR